MYYIILSYLILSYLILYYILYYIILYYIILYYIILYYIILYYNIYYHLQSCLTYATDTSLFSVRMDKRLQYILGVVSHSIMVPTTGPEKFCARRLKWTTENWGGDNELTCQNTPNMTSVTQRLQKAKNLCNYRLSTTSGFRIQ